MKTSHPKLLIIDSGVGGLSILNEIRKVVPWVNSDYIADNAFYPYGIKSEEEIIERVLDLASKAIASNEFSALVLACNTASTVALPALRRALNIPVIGVVPAIKPAAAMSQTKVIGLLATPGTIARQYTTDLIHAFAKDCNVIMLGTRELVDMAEDFLEDKHHPIEDYGQLLNRLWNQPDAFGLDTIVLGCTHFPLIMDQLKQASRDKDIQWVHSGEAIAKRVKINLCKDEHTHMENKTGEHVLYFTGDKEVTKELKHSLESVGVSTVKILN